MSRLSRYIFCFSCLFIPSAFHAQEPKLMLPIGHTEAVVSAKFSNDNKLALTVSSDGTAKLWEVASGSLLKDFKSGTDADLQLVIDANFSPNNEWIYLTMEGINISLYNMRSGRLIKFSNPGKTITSHMFNGRTNPGDKRILIGKEGKILVSESSSLRTVFELNSSGKDISDFQYSPDGTKIITATTDGNFRIWNALNGKPLTGFIEASEYIWAVNFSSDSKKIYVELVDGGLQIVDALTGKFLKTFPGQDNKTPVVPDGFRNVGMAPDGILINEQYDTPFSLFTSDGKSWIKLYGHHNYFDGRKQVIYWDSVSVRNLATGKLLYSSGRLKIASPSDLLSYEGRKMILIHDGDNRLMIPGSIELIDPVTGKRIKEIRGRYELFYTAIFNRSTTQVLTTGTGGIKIWDVETGAPLPGKTLHLPAHEARFSPDNKMVIAACNDKVARIWDLFIAKPLVELKGQTMMVVRANYDSSGKKILIKTMDKNLAWDIENGSLSRIPGNGMKEDSLFRLDWHSTPHGGVSYSPDSSLRLHWAAFLVSVFDEKTSRFYEIAERETEIRYDVQFSPDYKKLLVTAANSTITLFDIKSGRRIFTFVAVDSSNYLVTDSSNRYDGTEAARKLLYFTCGNEIIGLDQVKDQLWVPNLAQRIQDGEPVNAKTLNELGICGLTPVVEQARGLTNEHYFKIKPRRGGLGETILSINGTPTYSYQPKQLKKVGTTYELKVKKEELSSYFIEGQENSIAVKAYTSDNTSSSHNFTIFEDPDKEKRLPPNLYAVMVGVSDYKGENLDLDYAAVDATDISKTLSAAAKKLLGDDHVFMYNLTTDKERYLLPEKKSIKSVFEEIGRKATANDILFIFLSGHGVVGEKTKQYYYLTADASSAAEESSFPNVGISTAELTEWIKPQNIKAQKRILILDACYSGQAINSFVKIGNEKQGFLAARGDDKSQQLRAIDKLNERSGLFILSASSSDQRAWESGVYSHGYLTYSLLKAIKLQPDILKEGKYLDVGRWLDAAGESVSEMAKDDGSKQQPQIVSSTNFQIGLVDEEVMSKINLSDAKPLFTSGNFLNTGEAVGDDDLDLRKLTDKQLEFLSRAEGGKKIFFLPSTNSSDAYSLTGSYTVNENAVTVKVKLKQDKIIKKQFDLSGTKDKPAELAEAIIAKAIELIESNK